MVSLDSNISKRDTLAAGDYFTVVDLGFMQIGVAICFDVRFPELTRIMALSGAEVMVFPLVFNMTTGLAHCELSLRIRAVDNQVYVIGCNPSRNEWASYVTYGDSMVVSPWGDILRRLDEKAGMLCSDIDLEKISEIRKPLPLLTSLRRDIYPLSNEGRVIFKVVGCIKYR